MCCATLVRSWTNCPVASGCRHPTGCAERRCRCRTPAWEPLNRYCSPPCLPRGSPNSRVLQLNPRSWTSSIFCRRWVRSSPSQPTGLFESRGCLGSVGTRTGPPLTPIKPQTRPPPPPPPPRKDAAGWAAAPLATEGSIYVGGARQDEMLTFLNVFRKVGGDFEINDEGIRFFHTGEPLHPVIIETDVHPGFMTDWQQPLVVALAKARGVSIVHETVYEQRFGFVDALVEMGASIDVRKECLGGMRCRFGQRNFHHSAVISGPTTLRGADIEVPDLRGGFSHLIAALTAEGRSTVSNVGIIARGYENFITKLQLLGADFTLDA